MVRIERRENELIRGTFSPCHPEPELGLLKIAHDPLVAKGGVSEFRAIPWILLGRKLSDVAQLAWLGEALNWALICRAELLIDGGNGSFVRPLI